MFVLTFQKRYHLISVHLVSLELYSSVDPKTKCFPGFCDTFYTSYLLLSEPIFYRHRNDIRKSLLLFELNRFLRGMYYLMNKSFLFDWQTKLLWQNKYHFRFTLLHYFPKNIHNQCKRIHLSNLAPVSIPPEQCRDHSKQSSKQTQPATNWNSVF